eukprot:2543105-Pleurochrysis_carterae.AAC.1
MGSAPRRAVVPCRSHNASVQCPPSRPPRRSRLRCCRNGHCSSSSAMHNDRTQRALRRRVRTHPPDPPPPRVSPLQGSPAGALQKAPLSRCRP